MKIEHKLENGKIRHICLQDENPFEQLDLTPENISSVSDEELNQLREAVHEIWRIRGSSENDDEAINASIIINNEYKRRERELPNKDKLDEITKTKEKTAVTGEEKGKEEKLKFIRELTEVFERNLPEYELIIKPKKKEVKRFATAK